MEYIETNKLINAFMGYPYNMTDSGYPSEVKYHSEWEYLMPVVEKIKDCGFWLEIYSDAATSECKILDRHRVVSNEKDHHTLLTCIYNSVVTFVIWYKINLTAQTK